MTLVEAIPAPPKPIAESEDGITKVMTLVDAVTGADRVISGMNDFVLDGEGLELAEDGGDGVTGVRFSGPGLEDYLVSAHKSLDPAAGAGFLAARRPRVACGCL